MKHNILITGGFGLLGKPLVLKLINLKHNVFILEKKNTKRLKFLSKDRPNQRLKARTQQAPNPVQKLKKRRKLLCGPIS